MLYEAVVGLVWEWESKMTPELLTEGGRLVRSLRHGGTRLLDREVSSLHSEDYERRTDLLE